jgi:hypothetical protein
MADALTRNPTNPNPLHPNKFQLNFARSPSLQFFCQSVTFPGISLSEIPRNTPFIDIYSPGEKATYDLLNVTFVVDEELKGWFEIHDWIRGLTFPEKFEEYQRLKQLSPLSDKNFPQFSDAAITILDSAQKPTYRIKFVDCFPISISSIVFAATDDPNSIVTADASFRFSYFDIDKLF